MDFSALCSDQSRSQSTMDTSDHLSVVDIHRYSDSDRFHSQPALPLRPNTLSAALVYLASSEIMERSEGLGLVDLMERDRRTREMEGRYGLWRRMCSKKKVTGR